MTHHFINITIITTATLLLSACAVIEAIIDPLTSRSAASTIAIAPSVGIATQPCG